MSCCRVITIETLYKFTPLDPTDLVEGKEHLFEDLNKFKICDLLGNECFGLFCNELLSGDTLSDNWKKVYSHTDFQRGAANWIYYYFLDSYGQTKFEEASTASIKLKMEGASIKAEQSFEDFKKDAIENNLVACWQVATACSDDVVIAESSSHEFDYDII